MFDDVEALEVNPHRVGNICQFPMSKGIRREKVAEFIVPPWLRNAKNRNERDANRYYPRSNRKHSQSTSPRKHGQSPLQPLRRG